MVANRLHNHKPVTGETLGISPDTWALIVFNNQHSTYLKVSPSCRSLTDNLLLSHIVKVTKSRSIFCMQDMKVRERQREKSWSQCSGGTVIRCQANNTRWSEVNRKRVSPDDVFFMQLQMSPKQQLRSSSPHRAAGFSLAHGTTQKSFVVLHCRLTDYVPIKTKV